MDMRPSFILPPLHVVVTLVVRFPAFKFLLRSHGNSCQMATPNPHCGELKGRSHVIGCEVHGPGTYYRLPPNRMTAFLITSG